MMCNKVLCYAFKEIYTKQFQRTVLTNYIRYTCTVPIASSNSQLLFKRDQWSAYPTKSNINLHCLSNSLSIYRQYSDKVDEKVPTTALSNPEKLKKAVKEYGSTVIVFHIGISLLSLGLFYGLVSSGIDPTPILQKLGLGDENLNRLAGNTGTFVLAYAIHKVFAPVRIGITLTATPLIVRHLRKIGWLRK